MDNSFKPSNNKWKKMIRKLNYNLLVNLHQAKKINLILMMINLKVFKGIKQLILMINNIIGKNDITNNSCYFNLYYFKNLFS